MTQDSGESARAQGAMAGKNAADPDRLLPGENPGSTDRGDAVHWVAVYKELLGFKQTMLEVTEAQRAAASGPAADELEASDLPLLLAEARRLQRRLAYWEARALELGR